MKSAETEAEVRRLASQGRRRRCEEEEKQAPEIRVKFAAIDIGSNAVRLLLARVIEEGDEPLLKKEVLVRMPLRLGDDCVSRWPHLRGQRPSGLADTMVGFRHLIRAYPALDFAAYATSCHARGLQRRDGRGARAQDGGNLHRHH
jgi:hypothetical protein